MPGGLKFSMIWSVPILPANPAFEIANLLFTCGSALFVINF